MFRFPAHRPAAGSGSVGFFHGLSGRRGGVAKALMWRIRSGGTALWRRAAECAVRVGVDELLEGGLVDEHGDYRPLAMLVGRTRQPAQAPPSSRRMIWECGPVASGSAWGPIAASSWAVAYSSGKGSVGARVGRVAAAWRRRWVSALLQAHVAVLWGLAVSGGGGPLFSPLVVRGFPWGVSSAGVGGWVERASRPRGRCRSKDGRLTVPMAMGSIIRLYEQSCEAGSSVAAASGLPRRR